MISKKIADKLQDQEYRTAFVASQINIGIPFQIKALMKARGWTQEQLAERTGMLQPRISAMLKPGKVRPNIETLRRYAEAFDCGLLVRFAPYSELARWSEEFDPEHFTVPSFSEDMGFVERHGVASEPLWQPPLNQATGTLGFEVTMSGQAKGPEQAIISGSAARSQPSSGIELAVSRANAAPHHDY